MLKFMLEKPSSFAQQIKHRAILLHCNAAIRQHMQAHHKKIALLQMTVLSKKLVGHANVITEAADHVFALLFKHYSNEFFS